jgi:hypothetical protein
VLGLCSPRHGEPALPPWAMARLGCPQALDLEGSRRWRSPGQRDSPRPTSASQGAGGH